MAGRTAWEAFDDLKVELLGAPGSCDYDADLAGEGDPGVDAVEEFRDLLDHAMRSALNYFASEHPGFEVALRIDGTHVDPEPVRA